jgi:hypothetical protein
VICSHGAYQRATIEPANALWRSLALFSATYGSPPLFRASIGQALALSPKDLLVLMLPGGILTSELEKRNSSATSSAEMVIEAAQFIWLRFILTTAFAGVPLLKAAAAQSNDPVVASRLSACSKNIFAQ